MPGEAFVCYKGIRLELIIFDDAGQNLHSYSEIEDRNLFISVSDL